MGLQECLIEDLAADDILSVCVEWWRAGADNSKEGMFNCFEESGMMVVLCRHGMVLAIVNMVVHANRIANLT